MLPLAGGSDCIMRDVDIGVENTPHVILLSSSNDTSNLFRSISFNFWPTTYTYTHTHTHNDKSASFL